MARVPWFRRRAHTPGMRRLSCVIALLGCQALPSRPAPRGLAPSPAVSTPWDAELARDPERDVRLDRVAAAAAESAATHHVIDATTLRRAMVEHVESGLWPYVLAVSGSDREIAADLATALAELRTETQLQAIGAAIASGPAGRVAVIVAVPPPSLPIAVEDLGAGPRIELRWTWHEEPAAFAVTPTSARRLESVVKIAERGAVAVELDCARDRGQIEINAGPLVVASVPSPCPADARDVPGAEGDIGPPARTRVEAEQRLFALINRERTSRGLRAVTWDPVAHRFARAHAAEMATGGYVGHQAPDGALLPARVARAGIKSAQVWENVGHASGAGEAHVAFVASPGHRANLLAPGATHGAVGMVREPGGDRFYIVEEFTRP